MKSPKPRSGKLKVKQSPVPFGFKRKNGRLVVDPRKKDFLREKYGKLADDPEFLAMMLEALMEWWHNLNSRRAKIAYQQKLARQGGK